jgi:P-type conjugative transfer protein TrbJ
MLMNKLIKHIFGITIIILQFSLIAKAFIVYDPSNWIQNSAIAANTAQQLVKQTQELQVALREIKNYNGSSGQWANIQNLLQQLAGKIQQGQALAYSMPNFDNEFKQKYPGYVASEDYQKSYSIWSQTGLDTLRSTLASVGMQASQFGNEQAAITQLSVLSQSADGRMQALQVGNMIATQQVAQLQKLRQLIMAQVNAQNTFSAYQIQKEQSVEASASSWIGSGDTSFPLYGSGHEATLKEIPPIY